MLTVVSCVAYLVGCGGVWGSAAALVEAAECLIVAHVMKSSSLQLLQKGACLCLAGASIGMQQDLHACSWGSQLQSCLPLGN